MAVQLLCWSVNRSNGCTTVMLVSKHIVWLLCHFHRICVINTLYIRKVYEQLLPAHVLKAACERGGGGQRQSGRDYSKM
jgi:hypothetical protein